MGVRLFWPIAKLDRARRLVYGYASTEALDSQGEIVTRAALEAALPAYMRFANIREMHQPSAVGVAEAALVDDKGLWLKAAIVDDDAWRKVASGVYKGFSIGGVVTARDVDAPNIITGVDLTEISLVDRPANPEAVFAVWKSAPGQENDMTNATFAPANDPTSGLTHYDLDGAADPPDGGRHDYADPGYQPDGKKRYPLDSEEQIRAAWSYIHHPANARAYTKPQLEHIKAKIVAAWKAHIHRDGPPSARPHGHGGAAKFAKLSADATRLSDLLDELDWLREQLPPEPANGDVEVAIERVAALLRGLLDAAAEDDDDDEEDDALERLAPDGRRRRGHRALRKLGARTAALEAELGAAMPLLLELKALVEKVAAQPAVVPPARLVAVDKGADLARELERIAEQPPAVTAFELIKRAIREPLPFGARLPKE